MLRAFDPAQGCITDTGATIKLWYNDEHALTLGVRRVVVKDSTGTKTTDYPVSAMGATNPSHAEHPLVGTTTTTGDQAGTDTNICGEPNCGRPMWPSLFITDITNDRNSRAGDWQYGGTPIAPDDVFGTWKAAVRTVDKTSRRRRSPDAGRDPAKNNWNLGVGGDSPPAGLTTGLRHEVRWNVSSLGLQPGRSTGSVRCDGDQNKTGGIRARPASTPGPGSASLTVRFHLRRERVRFSLKSWISGALDAEVPPQMEVLLATFRKDRAGSP